MIATVSFESATAVEDGGEVWEVPVEVDVLRIGSANRIRSGLGKLMQGSCIKSVMALYRNNKLTTFTVFYLIIIGVASTLHVS